MILISSTYFIMQINIYINRLSSGNAYTSLLHLNNDLTFSFEGKFTPRIKRGNLQLLYISCVYINLTLGCWEEIYPKPKKMEFVVAIHIYICCVGVFFFMISEEIYP